MSNEVIYRTQVLIFKDLMSDSHIGVCKAFDVFTAGASFQEVMDNLNSKITEKVNETDMEEFIKTHPETTGVEGGFVLQVVCKVHSKQKTTDSVDYHIEKLKNIILNKVH